MDENRNNGFGPSPENNGQNNNWVFSDKNDAPKTDGQTPGGYNHSGYDSKYSYSSYRSTAGQQQGPQQQAGPSAPNNDYSANFPPKESESYKWNYEDYQTHQQAGNAPKRKKNKGLKVFAMILCSILCVGVVTLAGYGVYSIVEGPQTSDSSAEALPEGSSEDLHLSLTDKPVTTETQLSNGELSIPERAQKALPSVVGIVAYYQGQNIFSGQSGQGQGSGIIASQDGYIITNAHVITGASNLKVVLHDGTEYNATLVGEDTKTDLAVIKVDASGLTPAEFGNSDQLVVGEQVITVGNPGGLELAGSITVGYVSALNRPISTSQGTTINCIQTDAAINPGNSGGALVNEYGQVIGINSQKIAATEYEGIGFAISINDAQPIINDLISYGYVTGRVRLGITAVEIDAFSAQVYGYQPGIGVTAVEAGTPASSAGLSAGDIITAVDGTSVTSFDELNKILEDKKVGDSVTLSVFRKSLQSYQSDKTLEIKVKLIEAGKETGTAAAPQQTQPSQGKTPSNPLQ